MRVALALCLSFALACAKAPPRAGSVRASAGAGGIEVSWDPAPAAVAYRVQLVDLDTGEPLGAPQTVRGTRATLPGGYSRSAGVWVDALPGERAYGFVSAGSAEGDGSAWQIFGPQDFREGELRAQFEALASSERLGVLLINAGGRDQAGATVGIDGAAVDAPVTVQAPRALLTEASSAAAVSLHDLVRAAQEEAPLQVAAPEPVGQRRSFCIVPGLQFSLHVRKPATLALSTAHAEFYVDDEDAAHYPASFFPALGQIFEDRVFGAVTGVFGPPTDVDRNGKLLVVLSHQLGTHLNGGWLLGYFGNDDVLRPRDPTPWCGAGGSNAADVIYLNDVANAQANGYSADEAAQSVFPATLAHELQHLINLNQRCLLRRCTGAEDTWLNEGLSKVAEDLAGFGWNGSQGRSEGAQYLGRGGDQLRGYDARSLTRWEGDPIGNYQGAHSFVRYFADRRGADFASRLLRGSGGIAGLEAALHMPFARAMAEARTGREAVEKLAAAEQKLAEMGDVERRVGEAHAMLEKMRNEFELEREGYAVSERDLRSKLTAESERNEALSAEQKALGEERESLQKQVDALEAEMNALRAQNSTLADVYATAKRLSEELARGAGDLATTLKKTPVEDSPDHPQVNLGATAS